MKQLALLCVLLAVAVACVVVSDGNVALVLAPLLLLSCGYAAWKLPLRWPLLVLTFLALTLENPADAPAEGLWKSPLQPLGALMLVHINVTVPTLKFMVFSGVDLVLIALAVLAVVRGATGSRLDGPPQAPGPIKGFVWLSLGALAWMWAYGLAQGGADVASSLWQVEHAAYVPLVTLLFLSAFRSSADTRALGKVVIAAAIIRATLALYIRHTVAPPPGQPKLDYAIGHADSMLFVVALCTIVALLVHRQVHRRWLLLLTFVIAPLLLAGMVANSRRLVWVELLASLAAIAVLTPWSSFKRSALRTAILGSPVALAYATVGWGSSSQVFAPVRTLRSVIDSRSDPSTLWRDLENYNLFYTLRHSPLLGAGYGHGYVEFIVLPDVSRFYPLERYLPHNSILGLWAFGGLVGFTALWALLWVGMYVAARAYRFATTNQDRAASLVSVVALIAYLVHCYGDLGLGTWMSVFLVSPALAVSSKLVVSTGGWSTSLRREFKVISVEPNQP